MPLSCFSIVAHHNVQLTNAAPLRAGCTGTASSPPNAVYTLGPESQAFPQSQPWVSFDTRNAGTVSITSESPRRGDGSLRLFTTAPADKAQVGVCDCDLATSTLQKTLNATLFSVRAACPQS